MKALILVGGFGTRLRPLTFSKPKPLVDFANRPMIFHQIAALAKVGVKEIVLAVNYQPEVMALAMHKVEEEFNIKITFSIETEPLGTAGPLGLARDILGADESPFFVLNSDVICEFPFASLLEFHLSHGKEAQGIVGNQINAGIYIFNPAILKRIPKKPSSIETYVFPRMAKDGELHATPLIGFWADVGQPKDFLTGQGLYLKSVSKHAPETLASDSFVEECVLIDPTAKIGQNCKIGPNVVIGPDVVIGSGVRLQKATIMRGAVVKDNAWIKTLSLDGIRVLADGLVLMALPYLVKTFKSKMRSILTEPLSCHIKEFQAIFLNPRL
ncbi:hypothetical protein BASA84_000575 [Batrachochytrium salamandrivorans]|nr:hypothetical protein BASA84_000575 [Batrachochytrium salamandrivorans]